MLIWVNIKNCIALWTFMRLYIYDQGTFKYCCCSVANLCLTLCVPWTIACQAPLSMEFHRQEYWSGLPFPSPKDCPNPEIEHVSPSLAGRFFTTVPPGKPNKKVNLFKTKNFCSANATSREWEDKPQTGRKYLQNTYLIKQLSKIYKELLKLSNKKTN